MIEITIQEAELLNDFLYTIRNSAMLQKQYSLSYLESIGMQNVLWEKMEQAKAEEIQKQYKQEVKAKFENIREAIQNECISYSEIVYLQEHAEYIESGDVELLQWVGVEKELYK